MSSKKKNSIIVDFSNAEASEHVTGSMYHVKSGDLELLLDCGLAQSNNLLRDYRANNAHFNFKAKNIITQQVNRFSFIKTISIVCKINQNSIITL